ncbi:MAG TPA: ferritin [Ignavibacteriaceae bacterium]|nr:ferritin [Ignavibacteriaceae bacterium]
MVTQKVQEALNKQLNLEMASSYLYLAMAAHFEEQNLIGFAKWMRVQAKEEYDHAMKFFEYLILTNSKVDLMKIDAPKSSWKLAYDVFQDTYEHEKVVTASIHKIYETAMSEKDYGTTSFLQWFITEQVEEESTASYYVERLKMIGDNKSGLLYLDKEMGKRA